MLIGHLWANKRFYGFESSKQQQQMWQTRDMGYIASNNDKNMSHDFIYFIE